MTKNPLCFRVGLKRFSLVFHTILRQNLCVSFSRVFFVCTIFYTFSNYYIFEIVDTDIIVIIVKLVVRIFVKIVKIVSPSASIVPVFLFFLASK